MAASGSYASGSLFTVTSKYSAPSRRFEVRSGVSDREPNDPSFDLAVIQFDDDGKYLDPSQIAAGEECVSAVRTSARNRNGAVVVVFIHGWHHGAHWDRSPSTPPDEPDGDTHFHQFRLLLESLALREAERYLQDPEPSATTEKVSPGGRRVIGIYIGWNGDPLSRAAINRIPLLNTLSFGNRYNTAATIAGSTDFHDMLRRLISSTKQPVASSSDRDERPRSDSPVIIMGHSLGGLMLESAFLSLLDSSDPPLYYPRRPASYTIETRRRNEPISFPDLLLALNSAANSKITKRIIHTLNDQNITKTATAERLRYAPPLLISATSVADWVTKYVWRLAQGHRFWWKTDGHDRSIFTHELIWTARRITCQRRDFLDLGQNWHCLRPPSPPDAATPRIPIDLPVRERRDQDDDEVPHDRSTLIPLGDMNVAHPAWVFQVPSELIKDHNDIFNSRARSLILALIQIAGAVVSVAEDWPRSFEPDDANHP